MQICKYCNSEGRNKCIAIISSPSNKERGKSLSDLIEEYADGRIEAEIELSIRFQYFSCRFISNKMSYNRLAERYQTVFETISKTYETIIEQGVIEKCLPKIQGIEDKNRQDYEINSCIGRHLKQSYHYEDIQDQGKLKFSQKRKHILAYMKIRLQNCDDFDYDKLRDAFSVKGYRDRVGNESNTPDLLNPNDFYQELRLMLKDKRIENIDALIKDIFLYYQQETGLNDMPVSSNEYVNLSDALLAIKGFEDISFMSMDAEDAILFQDNEGLSLHETMGDLSSSDEENLYCEIDWDSLLDIEIERVLDKRRRLTQAERDIRKQFLVELFLEEGKDIEGKIPISKIIPKYKELGLADNCFKKDEDLKRVQMELYYDRQKIEARLLKHLIDYIEPEGLKIYLLQIARGFIRDKQKQDEWVDKQIRRFSIFMK